MSEDSLGARAQEMTDPFLTMLTQCGVASSARVLDVCMGARPLDGADVFFGEGAYAQVDLSVNANALENAAQHGDFNVVLVRSALQGLDDKQVRDLFARLSAVLASDARGFFTYFDAPPDAPRDLEVFRNNNTTTSFETRPRHFSFQQMSQFAAAVGAEAKWGGAFHHPQGEFFFEIAFQPSSNEHDRAVRALSSLHEAPEAYIDQPPGGDHHRAYVGPPQRYDFMSATQMALLYFLGVREDDAVLDIGCGSMRLGRLLIPFLKPDRYYGVDPNWRLIEEGARHECGADMVRAKRPRFSTNPQFDFRSLGRKFDYIIAQSIATHTGPDQLASLFRGAKAGLIENGLFLFSFIRKDNPRDLKPGWYYPHTVGYSQAMIDDALDAQGLVGRQTAWFHPAASWMIAAHKREMLPTSELLEGLGGRVFQRVERKLRYYD
ncbi:MAG: class I SAM-dependent methyltransferase [Pseudomonadota bacterium]